MCGFLNYPSAIYSLDPNCFWCVKLKRCHFSAIWLQRHHARFSCSVLSLFIGTRWKPQTMPFHDTPTNMFAAWNVRLFAKSSLFLVSFVIIFGCVIIKGFFPSAHVAVAYALQAKVVFENSLISSYCSCWRMCHFSETISRFEDPCNSMSTQSCNEFFSFSFPAFDSLFFFSLVLQTWR